MAKLNILTPPDPRLRQVSSPVDEINEEVLKLLQDMLDTADENTAGLAAPQVGVNKRVLIMEIPLLDECGKPMDESHRTPYHDVMLQIINPEIVSKSDEIVLSEEGCLSLPGLAVPVKRHRHVEVKFMDPAGKMHQFIAPGLLGICFQHEIDHLNGILSIDYLSKFKREMALRKLKRITTSLT